MPKFFEDDLRAEAQKKGLTGKAADRYVYGAMNNRGVMKGNQETAKGVAMDAKHARDVVAGKAKGQKKRATPRDDSAGTFTGPAGPFGTISRASKAYRKNPPTFAGRRQASRQQYMPSDTGEDDSY